MQEEPPELTFERGPLAGFWIVTLIYGRPNVGITAWHILRAGIILQPTHAKPKLALEVSLLRGLDMRLQ